jgi:hypothetical protein
MPRHCNATLKPEAKAGDTSWEYHEPQELNIELQVLQNWGIHLAIRISQHPNVNNL